MKIFLHEIINFAEKGKSMEKLEDFETFLPQNCDFFLNGGSFWDLTFGSYDF